MATDTQAEMAPGFRALLDMLARAPQTPVSIEQQRSAFRRLCQVTDAPGPAEVAAADFTIPTRGGARPARLYTPPGLAAVSPGLLYLHGGGYVLGDLDTHDGLCRRLAMRAGVRVVALDYRLAPENPFPAGHDDALDAALWLRDHGAEIGIDANALAIAGDSAGGNLAAGTCLSLRDAGGTQPVLQALLYPGFDASGTQSLADFAEGFFLTAESIAQFSAHLAPPKEGPELFRVAPDKAGDLRGLPPAFVTTGGLDPLRDCGARYARALAQAGVAVTYRDYPGFIHGFYTMSAIWPGVDGAIDDLAQSLRAALGTEPAGA